MDAFLSNSAQIIHTKRLSNADLTGTDLSAAVLEDAVLKSAKLQGANLEMAFLKGAVLEGADLSNATLQDAFDVTGERLAACKSLEGATVPNGQDYGEWLQTPQGQAWLTTYKKPVPGAG